ncbi:MAG: DEAD/DEAH box helicase family protein [Solirubrobacteraceae bacterium]|nr:DEAD/DEAH box helicase family protein [Solirubrobacteraceae bacterium]
MSTLRGWQERALTQLRAWNGDGGPSAPFLISAAPGAGKTRPSLVFAKELLDAGVIRRVVVVCPTTPLTRQWAEAAAKLGVHLQPDAEELQPPKDFHGVSVTYARAAASAVRWEKQCTEGTLVIADEAHHLGDDLAWGEGFTLAFRRTKRWLLLSGTPFRSDQSAIPGVRYEDGVAEPDVSYTYADAVRDGICRPVAFIPFDGTLSWQSGDDTIEASFSDVLTGREASRRYRTAISTDLADGLPRILRTAHERLQGLRSGDHKDAGGLVIASDGGHARRVAKVLHEITGRSPVVVLHDDTRSHQKLADFTKSRDAWIVAVNMVSEGVDIPRLRVGVYASAAKTPLIFRQVVGRFVRTIQGRPEREASWLYLPGEGALRAHASDVETELRHVLRPPGDDDGLDLFDEPPNRQQSERTEEIAFVPVHAEVSPQMALFGGGPPAPKVAPSPFLTPTAPAPAAAAEPEPDEMPAWQRRGILRDKRKDLVGSLARMQGRSHRDLNAWVNKETGVTRVDDATIAQLEKSIDVLLGALERGSRSRRAS